MYLSSIIGDQDRENGRNQYLSRFAPSKPPPHTFRASNWPEVLFAPILFSNFRLQTFLHSRKKATFPFQDIFFEYFRHKKEKEEGGEGEMLTYLHNKDSWACCTICSHVCMRESLLKGGIFTIEKGGGGEERWRTRWNVWLTRKTST